MSEDSFLRIHHIIGDAKRGIAPMYPVSRAKWYAGIKAGRYPAPYRIDTNTSAWRKSDILKLIDDTIAAQTLIDQLPKK